MEKIFLLSLGCPKNLVDSENILALLGERGYILTDSHKDADIIIINTCAFLKTAVEESKTAIKELAADKKRDSKIIVCGCLVERYGNELFNLRGVDGIAGAGTPEKVIEAVGGVKNNIKKANFFPGFNKSCNASAPRLVSTYPYAYLKIAEGCDNLCSYCLIPQLRGRLKSKPIKILTEEAEALAEMGIKELILIAQDTASYGKDIGIKRGLEKLLSKLVKLDFEWLRIMYAHPAHIEEGLIETIAGSEKICKYLDIPLQHIHPEILSKMNRPLADYGRMIDRIRKAAPEIRLRTTFIVGFPGEKDRHFNQLLDFVKEKRFDRLGVFRYSREKGTAAYMLPGQVKEDVKIKRERIVMEAQKKISEANLKKLAGKDLKVLIEGANKEYIRGRTEFDAPEIDGAVYIKKGKKKIKPGDFCRVRIVSSKEHDLFGI